MLKFPDNTMVSLDGLDDIMAQLRAENRKANDETAKEMIVRLRAKKNSIPSSYLAQREYVFVLLREYRKYLEERIDPKR